LPATPGNSSDDDIGLLELADSASSSKPAPGAKQDTAPKPSGPPAQVTLSSTGPNPYELIKRAAELDIKAPGPTLQQVRPEPEKETGSLLPVYLGVGAGVLLLVVLIALFLFS
jgi:hypothetical protein